MWRIAWRGIVPADLTVVLQILSLHDPSLAPGGWGRLASAFAMWFPDEGWLKMEAPGKGRNGAET